MFIYYETKEVIMMTLAQINWTAIIAGLGLFLFGIEYMGDGLKKYSGDKLKNIIDKYTSSTFKNIIIGAVVTCLIQSSSGTTVLTIGLIRSGLMSLKQSVGIIMGAIIGTVITSIFVGLRFSQYSVYFIIFGAAFLFFSKNRRTKCLGQVIFGFGCLFYGLELMGNNLANMAKVPEFIQITNYLVKNPILGLFGGIILTAFVQSSAAIIALIQQMYDAGAISLLIALPFLFGSNIGTTITAIIASLNGSTLAKRAAFFHVLFNTVGALIFMICLLPFSYLIEYLSDLLNISAKLQLSLAHGTFNILTALLFIPFIPKVLTLTKKVIKSSKKELEMDLSELDTNVIQLFPSHALVICKNKTIEMGKITVLAVKETKNYFQSKNPDIISNIYESEDLINTLDTKITDYLILINHETLTDQQTSEYLTNMKTIKDFERIGDLCINITRYFEAIYSENEDFSIEARLDIETMMNLVIDMLQRSIEAYDLHNYDDIKYVENKENDLDYFNKKAKQRHIKRVGDNKEKSPLVNSTYVDILANLERIGDHCQNVAKSYLIEDDF